MKKARPAKSTLQLAAAIDRRLIRGKGESVRFLVVDVTAPTVAAEKPAKAPLNLALVIDASGSMAGHPITAAKEAALRLAESLGEKDRLTVVSFDSEVTVHVDGRRQDAAGRTAAAVAIRGLEAGSSTNLSGGWLKGCERVANRMEREPTLRALRNHVVLLSDGQANVGLLEPDELASHAAELCTRGLFSSAVGIGEGYSEVQLGAIAASGGGRFHHAAEAAEIVELVLGELGELRATVIEKCDLTVELPAGFAAEIVGDYAAKRDGDRHTFVLGSLSSGASRCAVVKLTCPAGKQGECVELKVAARSKGVESGKVVETPEIGCELEFATGKACLAQPRERDLAQRVAQAWQLAIVRAATRLNQQGELRRAAKYVAAELKHLERYCEGLPGAQELLAPLQRMARSVGEVVYAAKPAMEMMNSARKATRGERELRQYAPGDWDRSLPQ